MLLATKPIPFERVAPDPEGFALSVENLSKRYWLKGVAPATFQETLLDVVRRVRATPYWALRDVSFTVGPGESVGIIGANGAGKSTLLRLICGLGKPTTGQVSARGRMAAVLEIGAGFNLHLTGRENLFVTAVVAGLRRREVTELYDKIVDFAEMGDFIDQPLRTYSTGMRMRLGFSIAIHVDPALMIIDETLSVGDAHFQQKCLDRIEGFRRDGKTLIITSHSMDVLTSFCRRALWLQRGMLVADGPIHDIVPKYSAAIQQRTLFVTRDEPEHV